MKTGPLVVCREDAIRYLSDLVVWAKKNGKLPAAATSVNEDEDENEDSDEENEDNSDEEK